MFEWCFAPFKTLKEHAVICDEPENHAGELVRRGMCRNSFRLLDFGDFVSDFSRFTNGSIQGATISDGAAVDRRDNHSDIPIVQEQFKPRNLIIAEWLRPDFMCKGRIIGAAPKLINHPIHLIFIGRPGKMRKK
jgi:hypothetical protein